jgi:uncharacterized cupin superfamily protein
MSQREVVWILMGAVLIAVGRNEPAVRNGDTMPVPGVPQHLLESANGTLQ